MPTALPRLSPLAWQMSGSPAWGGARSRARRTRRSQLAPGAVASVTMQGGMPRERTDRDLVASAQRGQRAAFEELVARHADRLHGVAWRLVGDEHDAREITQEAFLRAWRGLSGFQAESEFFTWLYRIAMNEAKRLQGRRGRASAAAARSLDDLPVEPADPAAGPEALAEHRALRVALDRAVAGLALKYRAPLVLRDIEGLSTQEAAAILDLSEAAFKSRLHRARMQVRAAVAELL